MGDRAMFSEDGLARGAYSPYPTPPTLSAHSNSTTCAQHTSDGNDQHSSCDVHGDCAVGRGPAAVASAEVTAVGQDDPQALHASSRMACARALDHSCCPHDHGMHAKTSVCPGDVSVAALGANTPHSQGACSHLASREAPLDEADRLNSMRLSSVSISADQRTLSDAPLINFDDVSIPQVRTDASPNCEASGARMGPAGRVPAAPVGFQTTCNSHCDSESNVAAARMSTAQYVSMMQQRFKQLSTASESLQSEMRVLACELSRCESKCDNTACDATMMGCGGAGKSPMSHDLLHTSTPGVSGDGYTLPSEGADPPGASSMHTAHSLALLSGVSGDGYPLPSEGADPPGASSISGVLGARDPLPSEGLISPGASYNIASASSVGPSVVCSNLKGFVTSS